VNIYDRFHNVVANSPIPTVLHLGAANGSDCIWQLTHLRDLKRPFIFVALEPDSRHQPNLQNLGVDAIVVEAAISDTDGAAPFYASDGDAGNGFKYWDSGSVRQPTGHLEHWPNCKFTQTYSVRCVRFDTLLADYRIPKVDFIWADLQGNESDLIDGAGARLKDVHYLYTEYANTELYRGQILLPTMLETMAHLGWELVEQYENDVYLVNKEFQRE
jgi:FkbM family methyltransferase